MQAPGILNYTYKYRTIYTTEIFGAFSIKLRYFCFTAYFQKLNRNLLLKFKFIDKKVIKHQIDSFIITE